MVCRCCFDNRIAQHLPLRPAGRRIRRHLALQYQSRPSSFLEFAEHFLPPQFATVVRHILANLQTRYVNLSPTWTKASWNAMRSKFSEIVPSLTVWNNYVAVVCILIEYRMATDQTNR